MTKAAVAPEQQARVAEAWVRIWASVALDMVKDGRGGEVIAAELASQLSADELARIRGWAESLAHAARKAQLTQGGGRMFSEGRRNPLG